MSYTVWVGGVPAVEKVEYSTALEVYYIYKYDKSYGDTTLEYVPSEKTKK